MYFIVFFIRCNDNKFFLNHQLVSLPPVRIFNKFLFNLHLFALFSVPSSRTSTIELSDLVIYVCFSNISFFTEKPKFSF